MTFADETTVRLPSEWLVEMSLRVLADLEVDEVEVEASHLLVDLVVELAERGEVLPTDTRDPAGGFGGTDLLIATVVPALAAARSLRRTGALTLPVLESSVDDALRRVGSPRAAERRSELIAAIRTALDADIRGAGG